MNAETILARITSVCERGGDVQVAAVDRLNPHSGYQAIVTLPDGTRNGAEFRGSGDTPAAALVGALARAVPAFPRPAAAPPRRPSDRIEGRWYITDRAAREYAHLMRPRPLDTDEATDELIELSAQAHLVRQQDNGLALWRVRAANGARIRLLVGEPDVQGPGKPALVQVLGEHGGAGR